MGLFDAMAALLGGQETPGPTVPAGNVHVRLDHAGSNKIAIIKIVKEASGIGLRESKDLVEAAPTVVARVATPAQAHALIAALGAAGAKASVVGAAASQAPDPSAAEHHVRLNSAGPALIEVIKAIRTHTGGSLAECKAYTDSAPCQIGPLGEETALALLMALVEAGADAEMV